MRLSHAFVLAGAFSLLAGATTQATELPAEARLAPEAKAAVRRLVIQHQGRNKPFDSFARETLSLITGEARVGAQDPVDTVCALLANPESWEAQPLIVVPYGPLREPLGMGPKATHVSYRHLVSTRSLMRRLPAIVAKQQRDEKLTMLENETMDVFQRFVALSALLEQKLSLVPPPQPGERVWLLIFEPTGYPAKTQEEIRDAWVAFTAAVRAGQAGTMTTTSRRLAQVLGGLRLDARPPQWQIELEVAYNLAMPFRIAWILYALVSASFLLGVGHRRARWNWVGMASLWAAFAVHAAGIAMRVIIGGRPPVSNFFETVLWLPFVGVIVGLILTRVTRRREAALAASLLAFIALILSEHLPLDASISPVVAVLRSNLWLTVHVLTIVASYGALALATVVSHFYCAMWLRPRPRRARLALLEQLLYRILQVGVVLLAGGVMLGAVWANASWGRYWGWDPKETWALITLLWFLAVLHGRFAGWLRGVGVAVTTIGGFLLLLMTYYGVSFYLVGLHSYAGGNAKPLPALLVGYLVAEAVFLAMVAARQWRRGLVRI